jgi:DNA-directed RNA polymerase II subunit RPB1
VRDAVGNIVQHSYGPDGYDSIKLEHVPINIMERDDHMMSKKYEWVITDSLESVFTKEAYDEFLKDDKNILLAEWNQLLKDRDDLRYKYFPNQEVDTVLAPINLKRLVHQVINQFQVKDYNLVDLTPKNVISMVNEIVDYVSIHNINKEFCPILKILIRSNLSSKQCLLEYRLNSSILKHLLDMIKDKILNAIVNPGEMVGIIAAQSIGEPVTQLTLNAFHHTGGKKGAVLTTAGVPRILEIIGMTKSIKTPSMLIYLKEQYCQNKDVALKLKNEIEYTKLEDLILTSKIFYLPDKASGVYPEDKKENEIFREINEVTKTQCLDDDSLSNWVLWVEFNREAMLDKGVYMQDIKDEINKNCNVGTEIQCIISNMNSEHLTLRVRIKKQTSEDDEQISFFKNLGDCLLSLRLRGIDNINKVEIDEKRKVVYNQDGKQEIIEEYVLNTDGSNLYSILSNKYVDEVRTTTNDISEIHNLFGIEGTRSAIIREINDTIKAGASATINNRHYAILADLMTHRGVVMQIQSSGFGKSPNVGPLGRASFEVMDQVLITAGIFAKKDNMQGTSSNVIFAQGVKAGTNSFELCINKNLLPEPKVEKSFIDNMNTKELKLDNYLKTIEKESTIVDDTDFNFGYGILNLEEHKLPESNVKNIELNIVKSNNVKRTKKRRKR